MLQQYHPCDEAVFEQIFHRISLLFIIDAIAPSLHESKATFRLLFYSCKNYFK